jgi:hypothetical protein
VVPELIPIPRLRPCWGVLARFRCGCYRFALGPYISRSCTTLNEDGISHWWAMCGPTGSADMIEILTRVPPTGEGVRFDVA